MATMLASCHSLLLNDDANVQRKRTFVNTYGNSDLRAWKVQIIKAVYLDM